MKREEHDSKALVDTLNKHSETETGKKTGNCFELNLLQNQSIIYIPCTVKLISLVHPHAATRPRAPMGNVVYVHVTAWNAGLKGVLMASNAFSFPG